MTLPVVVGLTTYDAGGPGLSWTPVSGIDVAANSVIVVSSGKNDDDLTTVSANWSRVGQVKGGNATSALFKKTATGTHDLVVASAKNSEKSAILLRATGAEGVSATSIVDSNDPPDHSLGPGYDVLWIVALTGKNGEVASAAPSAYGGLVTVATGSGADEVGTSMAYRTVSGSSSENPGAFTSDASKAAAAWTIAAYVVAHQRARSSGFV